MKKNIILLSSLLLSSVAYSQVGIGTDVVHPSAILEIASGKGGVILPQVDNVGERDQINSGDIATGLLVYNKESKCLEVYTGTQWNKFCGEISASYKTSVAFKQSTLTINETDATATLTFSITNPSQYNATTFDVVLTGGTATVGSDYSFTSPQTVTFPANSSADQSITFSLINDTDVESDETINFEIQNVTGGSNAEKGAISTEIVTIKSEDSSTPGTNVLFSQGFETSETINYTTSGGTVQTGTATAPSGANKFNTGSQGWGGGGSSNITFSSIDATGKTNIALSFKLAAFSGTSGNGVESSDNVAIAISTDGGATWSEELRVVGGPDTTDNNIWTFASTNTGIASAVYTGLDTPTVVTGPNNTGSSQIVRTGNEALRNISITNLPASSQLAIRITMTSGGANEIWVIDDVELKCD